MSFEAYILRYNDVTHTIRVITIQLPKDKMFDFVPGQYIRLEIDGEDPRYFSIASAPRANNTIDIHVRNSGQNLSYRLCHNIQLGEKLSISHPMGSLCMHETDAPVVFIAGGTGITPFLAMLEANPNKPVTLYWGMQSEYEFYIRPHRQGLAVHYCVETYPVDDFLKDRIEGAHIYLSGPPAMVKDSRVKLLAAGVEPSNIHHDE